MNLMLAAGGYPWTIVPVTAREPYLDALEEASVRENIVPFAEFIRGLVSKGLAGEGAAANPPILVLTRVLVLDEPI